MTTYLTRLNQVAELDTTDLAEMGNAAERHPFRANNYYLSLINWHDPADPIRRLVLPLAEEEEPRWEKRTSFDSNSHTIIPGLEHRYPSTAYLLVSDLCAGICRFCFRKHFFLKQRREVLSDLDAAMDYIRQHTEITNVVLTGGDPLMLSTEKLGAVINAVASIKHVQILRIGTKVPALDPYRILDDLDLTDLLAGYASSRRSLYVMVHFNHPRELTDAAICALAFLRKSGAILANQTPLIRGVNDDPATLAELLQHLCFVGVSPYYVFQCRPDMASKAYVVPIEESYQIFEQAKSGVSDLARRARFIIEHPTGKIQVVGMTNDHIFFKYHRAVHAADNGKFLAFRRNPTAYWFDDYEEVTSDRSVFEHFAPTGS